MLTSMCFADLSWQILLPGMALRGRARTTTSRKANQRKQLWSCGKKLEPCNQWDTRSSCGTM